MNEDRERDKIKISDSLEGLFESEITENSLKNGKRIKIDNNKVVLKDKIGDNGLINCPTGIKSIPITRHAFEDIILMAKAINELSKDYWGIDSEKLEVYCYVLTDNIEDIPDKQLQISEIYIPYHEVSETNVQVREEGIREVKQYITNNNKILLGWAHSHGHFDVYSSKTDEKNHKTLLNDTSNYVKIDRFQLKYIYGITVIESGEHLGVILTQYPCGNIERVEDRKFDILQGEPYTNSEKEIKLEHIKQILTDRVKIIKPGDKKSEEERIEEVSQEFLTEFIRNLRKSKNLLFDELNEEIDEHFDFFQKTLQKYDNLLIDSAEECFYSTSKRLLKAIKNIKESH